VRTRIRPLLLLLLLVGVVLGSVWWLWPRPRVLLIGVDGAEWTILRPLLDAGKLPNLARLRSEGVHGEILSIENFQASPVIWTSVATGKVPDKHGVLFFTSHVPGTNLAVPVTSTVRAVEAFWNIVSRAGRRVGVIGWWATWPPEAVNGAMVSDHYSVKLGELNNPYPREALAEETYPPELMERLRPLRMAPDEVPPAEVLRFLTEAAPAAPAADGIDRLLRLRIALGIDASHARAARTVWELYRPDVLAVYFEGIDIVQHFFWEFMDPTALPFTPDAADVARYREVIRRYYVHIDGLVGDLLRLVGERTTVLLVSDHGFVPSQLRYKKGISGEHRREAVFLGVGPGLRRGVEVKGASLLDVTPTMLYLLGLPHGADMDGRVLSEAIDPELLRRRPVTTIATYDPPGGRPTAPLASPADAKLTERLRALGYLE
jgi:predicted AlkP superfamily phosphohydrolase/phosphomutase